MLDRPSLSDLQDWAARVQDLAGEGLSEAEAISVVGTLEELKGAAAAAQARVTAHLYAERQQREAAERVPARERCGGLGAEIALARRVSPRQGGTCLGVALALTREMPATLTALSAGQISEWTATVLVKETALLSAEHRGEVDRQLAPRLVGSGWGVRRVGNEARRIGYRLDPGAAIRRTSKAETDRRVTVRPAPDTMSYLTGHLPVAQGIACYAALARVADAAKAAGDPRSRSQVMADALVERLTGRSAAFGAPVEIELVMTDRTLFAGGSEPAHLVGHGTIPAELSRRLVREADRAFVRRLYTYPDSGALVAVDSRRRTFTGQLRHQLVLRNDTCATPYCDAPVRHADHPKPVRRGGTTGLHNAAGLAKPATTPRSCPVGTPSSTPGPTGRRCST